MRTAESILTILSLCNLTSIPQSEYLPPPALKPDGDDVSTGGGRGGDEIGTTDLSSRVVNEEVGSAEGRGRGGLQGGDGAGTVGTGAGVAQLLEEAGEGGGGVEQAEAAGELAQQALRRWDALDSFYCSFNEVLLKG